MGFGKTAIMISHPKPLAAERNLANHRRGTQLRLWRVSQYRKAINRDSGMCQICQKMVAQDVHHVYGRGKDMFDWREDYTNLMCVCRKCHPPAIKHKPAGPKLAWVEEILEKVNG